MENSFENTEELISKYLAGEAGRDEIARLDAWRVESPENEAHFNDSKKLFEAMEGAGAVLAVNVDAAWNKLNARIEEGETKVIPINQRFSFVRAAAAILLLAVLAFVVKLAFTSPEVQPTTILASTSTREQQLPDGSKVFMNKQSEISYVVKDGERKVKLKGEAFFEVVHNEKEPFVIEINDVMVKDIGTAFNVKALPESETIEVLVESGEVQFYSASNNGLLLTKGEKAVYNKTTKEFTKLTVASTDNSMSYKSKVFHFNNSSLKEVIDEVNAVYGSDIQLANGKLGNCRLSVEFNDENIDVLVGIIAETLDLQVEQKDGIILLKGEVCPE